MKHILYKNVIYFGANMSLLFFGLLTAGEQFNQKPPLYPDVIKIILYKALTSNCADVETLVQNFHLVNREFKKITDMIMHGDGDDDASRKLIHRYLMFALERCSQYALNNVYYENIDFVEKIKNLETFCFETVQLPYTNHIPLFSDTTQEQYTTFLHNCRKYLYTKSLTSYATYYGISPEIITTAINNYIFDVESNFTKPYNACFYPMRHIPDIEIEHIICTITSLPITCPSLYNEDFSSTEVILQITALDENACMRDDTSNYDNLHDYWRDKWTIFWQTYREISQEYEANEITLSFWSIHPDSSQINICIEAMPETICNICTRLDLTYCSLEKIPSSITQLHNLTWLDLWGNNIKKIPSFLAQNKLLQRLELTYNNITKIETKNFPFLPNLLTFSCESSHTKSAHIPLNKLPKLRYLSLKSNNCERVEFISSKDEQRKDLCSLLRYMDLSNNDYLRTAFLKIGKMKSLEHINLRGIDFDYHHVRSIILKIPKLKKLVLPENFAIKNYQKPLYKALVKKGALLNIPGSRKYDFLFE